MYRIKSFPKRHWSLTAVCLLLLSIGFLANRSTPVLAMGTTVVTTTSILDDPNDGECDLWEAMKAVFDYDGGTSQYHECSTNSSPHTIIFGGAAAGGTITLPTQLGGVPFSNMPYVRNELTIMGPVVIDGGGEDVNAHIFVVANSGEFTLSNVVVQNGYTSGGGGAILGNGSTNKLNIIGSSFQNNIAENRGGAINFSGELNILMSNFSGNRALGEDQNGTDYEGQGGAIYKGGYLPLTISLSNFAGNIAGEGGGAIYNNSADKVEIFDTVFNGNIVDDDAPTSDTEGGGAIYNRGNDEDEGMMIARSVFNGNLSFDGAGGAIHNTSDGYLHIQDSSFNANIAGDLTSAHMGGAIYSLELLDIRRVTFMGNISSKGNGGAIANDKRGEAYIANSTFIANGAPDGNGGAIWNGTTQTGGAASYTYLYNDTFSLNTSLNNGATLFNQTEDDHEIKVWNTIVNSLGIPGAGDACNEHLSTQGNNIDSGDTCGFTGTGDKENEDPKLNPPSFNGGPLASLLTMSLQAGSYAIDNGNNTICANEYVENKDQRSDNRPKGATCDIGAFETDELLPEYGSEPVDPGPIVIGNTSTGTAITNTFKVLNVGDDTLSILSASFSGPDAAEFTTLTTLPFNVSPSGNKLVVLECAGNSVGDKTATLTVTTNDLQNASVEYDVTCHVEALPVPGYGSSPTVPGPLDFGEIFVGNSGDRTLTFMETGNATLIVNGANLTGANPGDFTFNAFDGTINDGEPPTDVPITCTPSDYGVRTAVLSLNTNDPQQPTVSYNLVCEGLPVPPAPLAEPGYSYVDGQGGLATLNGAYDVAISPDGHYAYVTGFIDNSITFFSRNVETGQLTLVDSIDNNDVSELSGPQMVEISPDGTQVYVTARSSDSFLVFERNTDTGTLSLPPMVWTDTGMGGTVDGLEYPYGIVMSPDGRYIYVTGYVSDSLVIFSRDGNGVVAYDYTYYEAGPCPNQCLVNPYVPTISPDGRHLYITGGFGLASTDGYVTVYERDLLDGSVAFVQTRYDGQPIGFLTLNGLGEAWGIAVSPDGKHVYVAGYQDDAVVRFIRNQFDGKLTYGGYVTNNVMQVQNTEGTQSIEAVNAEGLDGARDVKFSPDGQYVYVTGALSDALSVFGRNPANGVLAQVQVINGNGNNPALNGAWEIGLSPDGTAVYATGNVGDSVVALHSANPVATLSSLLPASTQAGSPETTVRVQGDEFVPGAVVRVGNVERPSTYISPNEMEVDIPASDLAIAGTTWTIDVVNPEPGGGVSNNFLIFTVTDPADNPIPAIDYLQPQGAGAGDAALTLTVYGYNFMNGSIVRWNGVDRATTFVNSSEVKMTVTAQDLLSAGSAVVTVFNPGPGGGLSNAVVFDVAAQGQNPVPTITGISPKFVNAHGAASKPHVVTVTGENFIEDSQGRWNGSDRPTLFVSETELRVTLNAFDTAFGGSGAITVYNPPALPNPPDDGGVSNPATFIIYQYALYLSFITN